MLKNYLKIALRNLRKHQIYTVINVSGLAVGMACCVLIFMLVRHEWSFDSFHENADAIYKTVIQETRPDGSLDYRLLMPPSMHQPFGEAFPGIERHTRVVAGNIDLHRGNESFRQRLMEADSTFFELFTFPFLAGDPTTALDDPGSMVITEEVALKFFGEGEPGYRHALGEVLTIIRRDVPYDFTVSGVAKKIPTNSSLQFDAMISFENYENLRIGGNDWGGRTSTYLQLAEGQDPAALEAALPPFTATEFADRIERRRNGGFLAGGDEAFKLILQPLRDVHLNPIIGTAYEEAPHNPRYSYILSGIGLLVLLIACINFMTLSVGRSTSRAREVGMRKVLGALPRQLMKQFWGESVLLSMVALGLGLALAALALPIFNDLTGQSLTFSALLSRDGLLGLLGLMVIVGLIAGGYPAVVLSRFQPAAVLKGEVKMRGKNYLTRSLVVVQYTISIGLITSTVIMMQQLDFLMNRDLGYKQDQIIVVNTSQINPEQAPGMLEFFRSELLPRSEITHVAKMGYAFTRGGDRNTWTDANDVTHSAWNFGFDYDSIDLLGMEIVAGRTFSRDFPNDPTSSILVNEALVKEHGLEDPVGHVLTNWLSFIYDESPTIIGVVKDFHFESLHVEVKPAVMNMHPNYYNFMGSILIKIRPDDIAGTLAAVEATWNKVLPSKPFTYSFLDEDVASQYQTEERWGRIVTLSALFAILIACLGLFGLATLSVARRTKEIGIRKVLGASASGMMVLIAREFIILVGIATVVAAPLAYFGMTRWLETFAFRIEISWPIFLGAGLAALLIALLTVSYQAVRAATANPVKALRYE